METTQRQPEKLTGDQSQCIAITGSTGLVGGELVKELRERGFRVIRLLRQDPKEPDDRIWDSENPDPNLLKDVDVLVHLAGEPISGRWTKEKMRHIRESRIGPTRKLAELCASTISVKVMVCASAIGFYGTDRGSEVLTEASLPGEGFLADVTTEWEKSCDPARSAGVRVVNVRTGIVMSKKDGMLPLLTQLFAYGGGGPIGFGQRWMSWIDIDDLVRVYIRAIVSDEISGPLNGTSPEPVTNAHFTKALGVALKRPTALVIPPMAPAMLLGWEGAKELALANQRVQPRVLRDVRRRPFHFIYPTIEASLLHQLDDGEDD